MAAHINNLNSEELVVLRRLGAMDQECISILKGIHTLSHCGDLCLLHLSYAFDDVRDSLGKLQREVATVAHLFRCDDGHALTK